jgi:RNA polymerase sigma-70 factor (ECF subfamily)
VARNNEQPKHKQRLCSYLVPRLQFLGGMTIDALVRDHGPHLARLARRLCGNSIDADDLVQDVFEKTLRHPIPAGANARAWLARVLRNRFIDRLRRTAVRREEPIDDRDVACEPAAPTTDTGAIAAELARLPPLQRETLELFALHDRTYDEIAARLGIAKATVGTRILRARRTIALALAA